MAVDLETSPVALGEASDGRLEDLAQIIGAYNSVTEKLQRSHESLQSEVERLHQELASADAQLQRSKQLAALGQMAAGLAHEIRNPLAAIQLYAGVIASDLASLDPDELVLQAVASSMDHARKITSAVRGLDAIVHDVLSFAGVIRPRLNTCRVSDLFLRAVAAQQPGIEVARVSVQIDPGSEWLYVNADQDLMHQALLNLIRNATQAMDHSETGKSRPRQLTLSAVAESQYVVLIIADTGAGIDEGVMERIFDPFFTTCSTGTGLGLAIVFRILEAHGGSIRASNSDEPQGAVFQLRIPIAEIGCAEAKCHES